MTGRIEKDGVPKDAQTLTTGLTGKGRRSQRRKQDECGGSECVSHVGQGIGTCGVCPTNPPVMTNRGLRRAAKEEPSSWGWAGGPPHKGTLLEPGTA